MFVWFLSTLGERHEDHVPMGIFSNLAEIKKALGTNFETSYEGNSMVSFFSWADKKKGLLNYSYTAYRVKMNEYQPEILKT